MSTCLPKALCIMGPTATGKTGLSLTLCEQLNGEIISVDSALIYKTMDIGTAKPSLAEQSSVPHHLIDIIDPSTSYSAADFVSDARRLMNDIIARGKTPILVGGTMMYFRALFEGMSDLPEADQSVRTEIEAFAKEQGWAAVHQQLQAVDPVSAERIHPNDPQRLQRALEVYRISGKSMTAWRMQEKEKRLIFPFNTLQLAISPHERAILHRRIEQRFHQMIDQGFEQEVRRLYDRGDLHSDLPAIRAVGYRQMWAYLDGNDSFDNMLLKGIAATRQLAKRQYTWLRSWQNLHWIYTDMPHEHTTNEELLQNLLKKAEPIIKQWQD